ncbi:unnamed protein product [Phaeothamnion confervicola]
MHSARPSAVVLELCASRYRAVQRELAATAAASLTAAEAASVATAAGAALTGPRAAAAAAGGGESDDGAGGLQRARRVLGRWWKGVASTRDKHGPVQAALVGLLSMAYVAQKLAGNYEPGLEFKSAMIAASALDNGCAVVLGDRNVYETLRRLGGTRAPDSDGGDKDSEAAAVAAAGGEAALTRAAGGLVSAAASTAAASSAAARPAAAERGSTRERPPAAISAAAGLRPGRGAAAAAAAVRAVLVEGPLAAAEDLAILRKAIFGPPDSSWPLSVNVPAALLTRPRVLRDLAGLLGPMTLVLLALSESLQLAWGALAAGAEPAVDRTLAVVGDVLGMVLLAGSAALTLRFARLVIAERDEYLARAIAGACAENPGRPVVAVVGVLHCNGVSSLLQRGGLLGPGARLGGGDE